MILKCFITFVVVSFIVHVSMATMCYQCDKFQHQRGCIHATECSQNETCYVNRHSLSDGSLTFDSGCMTKADCPFIIPVITSSLSGMRSPEDSPASQKNCFLCCAGDFCNTELCDKPVNIEEGPRCLNCDHVNSPANCKNVVRCKKDEVCFTERIPNSKTPDFKMGCVTKSACRLRTVEVPIIGRRAGGGISACAECCQADHCNARLCTEGSNSKALYELTVDQTSTIFQCQDTSYEACQLIAHNTAVGCNNPNTKRICPKTCNACDFGCYDYAEFNCSDILKVFDICSDIPQAMKYCKKTCDYCDKVDWPPGSYMMVSTASGCPGNNITWSEFRINQRSLVNGTGFNSTANLHLAGTVTSTHLKFTMCNRTHDLQHYVGRPWPRGEYCIIRSGITWNDTCPSDFDKGILTWSYRHLVTNLTDMSGNAIHFVSLGHSSLGIAFCCRSDGSPDSPILLPNKKPFYLIKYTERCQQVYGMNVTEEFVQWPYVREGYNACQGAYPKDERCSKGHRVHLCYYHS